jgi:hypothetical protein
MEIDAAHPTSLSNGHGDGSQVSPSASIDEAHGEVIPSLPSPFLAPGDTNHFPPLRDDGDHVEPKPPKTVLLWDAIKRSLPRIWEISQVDSISVIKHKRMLDTGDKRLDDIRRVEGTRKPTSEEKLLRALAQRSLALEFTEYQEKYKKISRVDEVVTNLNSFRDGRAGKVSAYVANHPRLSIESIVAIDAIVGGIKRLVTERLLEERLRELQLPSDAIGVSEITALTISPYKSIPYPELPSFIGI